MIDTSSLRSLAGKHVVGEDGDKIGKLADVYESTDGGGGTFATVTTGLFGGGSSFFPLDTAVLRDDEVVVPYTKDFVKDAPRVENDEELSATEEERLFAYYRLGGATGAGVVTGPGVVMGSSGHETARLRKHVGTGVETSDGAVTGEKALPGHPVTAAHPAEGQVGDERTATGPGTHVLPEPGTSADPDRRTP